MTPWGATPKLVAYVALAAVACLGGVAAGRPAAVVLGAPFALAAAVGLLASRRPGVEVGAVATPERAVEGDDLEVVVPVRTTGAVASLEVAVALPDALVAPAGAALGTTAPGAGTVTATVAVTAGRWGRHDVGDVWVRARGWGGFVEGVVHRHQAVWVLVHPSPEHLRGLVEPRATTTIGGVHPSARTGSGTDVAEVRPHRPGDSLRAVNWRATARRDRLMVTDRHPDDAADVVVFLDAFSDAELARAVRAADALVQAHLAGRDRVGLVTFGGTLSWARPGGGERQRHALVDLLLGTRHHESSALKGIDLVAPSALPPKALVVAVTPLEDERVTGVLVDLRRRGVDVVAVEVTPELVGPALDATAAMGRRLWRLERETRRGAFRQLGIPVVPWQAGDALSTVVEEVRAWPRPAHARRH